MKTVLAISDMHCGHRVGLTPPSQWISSKKKEGKLQRALWSAFEASIELRPDVLLVVGDAIDGTGKRSGGTEQLTTDLLEQVEWATECIKFIKPKHIAMVAGTPYHVGDECDYEGLIAKELGAEFGGQLFIDVDGVVFGMKHKCGGSQVPHGRHTAVARERLNQQLWSEREMIPNSDIILRGHVHYHNYCGGPGWLAMTLPALQGLGSKYGERQCGGLVDFGAVLFHIEDGEYKWEARTQTIKEQAKQTVSLG